LTLFLRQAGAPLDNNLVERALKRAVLHRKNALFVHELDSHLSVVRRQLLRLLTELQRHAQKLAAKPAEWMPWNYRETVARIVSLADSA
jgi:transposase